MPSLPVSVIIVGISSHGSVVVYTWFRESAGIAAHPASLHGLQGSDDDGSLPVIIACCWRLVSAYKRMGLTDRDFSDNDTVSRYRPGAISTVSPGLAISTPRCMVLTGRVIVPALLLSPEGDT